MFICAVHQWSVIYLDLTWKQSFLILVDNEILWTMLPLPVRIDTLKRPRTFTSWRLNTQWKFQTFIFVTKIKRTFVLNKDGRPWRHSGELITWPGPTTGMTLQPTPMWQTISGGLAMTGFLQHCNIGDAWLGMNLKPRFQWQFTMQSDDKLIIDGLFNLAMKPNESTGKLLEESPKPRWLSRTAMPPTRTNWLPQPITMPMILGGHCHKMEEQLP